MKKKVLFFNHDIFLLRSEVSDYILYAPTLNTLLKIAKELAVQISERGIQACNENKGLNEVYEILKDKLPNAITPFDSMKSKPTILPLSLGLTRDCTLACLYCHADAGNKGEMSDEIMEYALEYAFNKAKSECKNGLTISFNAGGEPTFNWSKFTRCIGKIRVLERHYDLPVFLSMTTNGYYGEEKRKFIAKEFDSILVSLDGTPDIQNFQRPTIHTGDSYDMVHDSILYFKNKVHSFAIRSTVSDKTVRRLPEIINYYYKEFGNGFDVIFESLCKLGRAEDNTEIIKEPDQKDFVKYFIEAKKVGKSLGLKVNTSHIFRIGMLVTNFCGAMAYPSLTVTVNGTLTACGRDIEGETFNFGQLLPNTRETLINEEKIKNIYEISKIQKKCEDCFCKYHCAGGCPDARRFSNSCFITQELIKHELEEIINE